MLLTRDEAMRVVRDCTLAATAVSNSYAGRELCDVREYSGHHGHGYTVTTARKTEYYVYDDTYVSAEVYAGQYSVADACMTANNAHTVRYNGVPVTPTWRLELDTVTGETSYRRTEDYAPITLAGRTLTVCWRGGITQRELRARIRRKLREYVNSGKAILVKNFAVNTQEIEERS